MIEEIVKLAMSTDDDNEYIKYYNEKVFPRLKEMNIFFENKIYVAGDYLTYVDFDIAEFLLRFIALAKKILKAFYFLCFF